MPELDIAPKTPELTKTPEIVYGDYETVKLPTQAYVKMSQVRSERSRVGDELKESILNSGLGLISQIHVARMTPEDLATYVGFVNRVWKSETDFDQFAHQKQADGYFYLIVDGHSRHQAIEELEDEGKRPPGLIVSNVHKVNSPEEIIQLQMHANIHSAPPRERRAIAIVESYEWGLETGKWTSQSDYIKKHNDVSASVLSEALAFTNLPKEIRNCVFTKQIPYAAGVALGAAAPDFRRDIIRKTGLDGDLTEEEAESLEETVKTYLMVEVNRIITSRLNSTAAEKRVRAIREQMRRKLKESEDEQDGNQDSYQDALFGMGLKSSDELLAEELAKSKQLLAQYFFTYTTKPVSAVSELFSLGMDLLEPEVAKEILNDFKNNVELANRHIGSRASLAAAIDITPDSKDGLDDSLDEQRAEINRIFESELVVGE